jgi:N-dimethylarginine dimethylaminohydrolase
MSGLTTKARVTPVRERLIMAEPTVFRLSGEINAWMKRSQEPDPSVARAQWRALYKALKETGLAIDVLRQPLAWPDYVFTANAGLCATVNGVPTFIPSQLKYPERQGEQPFYERAYAKRGFQIARLFDPGESWEGEGDFMEHNGTLFGGYGWRSRVSAHQKVANFLDLPLITLHLEKPHFYHLDTALAFLDERSALYYPAAFDTASRTQLESHIAAIPGGRLIAVDAADAERFACNVVPVGRRLFMNEVSEGLASRLEMEAFLVTRLPLWEFIKSGGAAKCLTQWAPAFRMVSRPSEGERPVWKTASRGA